MKNHLKQWIAKNNLKKTRNHKAASYKVSADINGNINVNLTFKPDALAIVMDIAATLYQAATESINMVNRQRNDAFIIEQEHQQSLVSSKKESRIALSVYRRTSSKALASSMFKWMDKTHIMMMVNAADKRQKKAHLLARNKYMHRLHIEDCLSIRAIAKRYKLHPSTTGAIIKREAKALHPALF